MVAKYRGICGEAADRVTRVLSNALGCGDIGLATARLLQQHGWTVTIYARDLSPNTTSNLRALSEALHHHAADMASRNAAGSKAPGPRKCGSERRTREKQRRWREVLASRYLPVSRAAQVISDYAPR
jgi:2-polyprenyl-6-methoxyphenol hydroxylase-like FAD-dependent oxidoreductase